jgi:hypothetical protein
MRPRGAIVPVLFACMIAGVAATNPAWQDKDFKDWTQKDAQTLLTESPWAKAVPMPAIGRPGVVVIEPGANVASPPAASLGNASNTTTGANLSTPAIGGSNGPADQNGTHNLPTTPAPSAVSANTPAPAPPAALTVIWASATPIRLAVLKLRSGENAPDDEQIAHATAARPNYVLAVVGLPAPDGDSDPHALAQEAYIQAGANAPVRAIDSDYRRIGNSDVYFFRFARAASPITLSDGSVEFKMRMGKIAVKKKFDLAQMQYKGQLAL